MFKKNTKVKNEAKQAILDIVPHVFISQTKRDSINIQAFKDKGMNLYKIHTFAHFISWAENDSFNNASRKKQALMLREVMKKCLALVTVYSEHTQVAAESKNTNTKGEPLSRWIPWEIGFMDGSHGIEKCAVLPVIKKENEDIDFREQEYLAIYPTICNYNGKYIVSYDKGRAKSLKAWVFGQT